MKMKLWLLNFALLAACVATGWQIRESWLRADARGAALRVNPAAAARKAPATAPPAVPPPAPQPLTAANYADIAQKMLFVKDRNPVVVVVTPPPPPKPMPKLPVIYGVLALGDAATLIVADRTGAPQRGLRVGEKTGEFKLLAANSREVVFEWDGKEVRRKLEELMDRTLPSPAEQAQRPVAPSSLAPGGAIAVKQEESGPKSSSLGVAMGTFRACVPGDTAAAGAVVEGYKKVLEPSPFGQLCRWEPLK